MMFNKYFSRTIAINKITIIRPFLQLLQCFRCGELKIVEI